MVESRDVGAQFIILPKTNAQSGEVWQSHVFRYETLEDHSCRDLFGSIKEHLPKHVVGEVLGCRNLITTTTTSMEARV